MFEGQRVHKKILNKLQIEPSACDLVRWNLLNAHFNIKRRQVYTIEIVGKYTGLTDSYLSLIRSLEYASFQSNKSISIKFTDAENIDWTRMQNAHGVVIAGGFGLRGTQGKIECCKYARENNIPLLGICLGMQIIAIEFARNIMYLGDANSTEFDESTKNPVVCDIPEYQHREKGRHNETWSQERTYRQE